MDYIYFCRSSFCMGDDVCAPNMRRFEYSSESFTEEDMKTCITNYFTSNLCHFKWTGFCNGEFIASADCFGDDDNYQVVIELSDNWESMLKETRTIFFDHVGDYGMKSSQYYTLKRAEEVYNEHFNYKG